MTSQSFRINLPSIPGKPIRLRVQDIGKKGFMSRGHRFNSDKTKLTKQFCQTFDNLYEEQVPSSPQSFEKNQPSTQSTQYSDQIPFRYVVPEYKNNLLDILHKQQRLQQRAQLENLKRQKRTASQGNQVQDMFITMESKVRRFRENEEGKRIYMENYFFAERQKEREQRERAKQEFLKPSAMFLTESRERIYQRHVDHDESLGPGYYSMEPEKAIEKKKPYLVPKKKQDRLDDETTKLKKYTKQIFERHNIQLERKTQEQEKMVGLPQKKPHQDHMFVLDDRDRFGDQIFPIVLKTNVPGPGSYEMVSTIEDKARKVAVLQEQRKLLKDWFNQ